MSKKIPAIKPSINIINFRVEKPSTGKINLKDLDVKLGFSFDIVFKSNTASAMKLKDLKYDFFVNSDLLLEGATGSIRSKGNESIISVKNKFSSRSLGLSIIKAIPRKKGYYNLQGHAMIDLPASYKIEPVKLIFNEKGVLKIK